MHANGLALCKRLHTGAGEGIHTMPFPLWQFWATGRAGFRFVHSDAVTDEELLPEEDAARVPHDADGDVLPEQIEPGDAPC